MDKKAIAAISLLGILTTGTLISMNNLMPISKKVKNIKDNKKEITFSKEENTESKSSENDLEDSNPKESSLLPEENHESTNTNELNNKSISQDIEKEIALVDKAVKNNIAAYPDNLSVYYYNLKTGASYGLNENREFLGASLRKLGIAMSVADDIHKGKIRKDQLIGYNPETDFQDGTGVLQYQDKIEPITVEYALELSMKYSDNIANKLLDKVALTNGTVYTENITGISTKDKHLTPKQVSILLKRLYENPDSNPIYDFLIATLKNTEFFDRMDKYIPRENVAHKIGSYYRYYHDADIFYGPNNNDFILIIMTKDFGPLPEDAGNNDKATLLDTGKEACEAIAKISRDIYNSVNNQ